MSTRMQAELVDELQALGTHRAAVDAAMGAMDCNQTTDSVDVGR